ncbi:uncharacterized protein LOC129808595 [Phlebotomus papatasi]|uniref:uncharacterized protein LOC129808595 n=1 Tax=Phlebotomus papatasi TaxID=29031 RepID=UPI0024841DCB|nr:uncharacterized protein LOC129808595 [Phlebotomus papatasi]
MPQDNPTANVLIEGVVDEQKDYINYFERTIRNIPRWPRERRTIEKYESQGYSVDNIFAQFCDNHTALVKHLDAQDRYFTENTFKKAKQLFDEIKKVINNKIEDLRKSPQSENDRDETKTDSSGEESNEDSDSESEECDEPARNRRHTIAKLPKLPAITIKTFNGEPKDEPTRVISNLELTEVNYDIALDKIKRRYNNDRKIVASYINAILDIKNVEFRNGNDIRKLHDILDECVTALGKMEDICPHSFITAFALRKLDSESSRIFEQNIKNARKMPTIAEFLEFLEARYHCISQEKNLEHKGNSKKSKSQRKSSFQSTASADFVCLWCNENHTISKCEKFKALSVAERNNAAKKKSLCFNCLNKYNVKDCTSKYKCKICFKKHHYSLHKDEVKQKTTAGSNGVSQATVANTDEAIVYAENVLSLHERSVESIFPTASVWVLGSNGKWQIFRALIDSGAGDNFITTKAAQSLRLNKEKPHFDDAFNAQVEAFGLPKLTGMLPSRNILLHEDVIPSNMTLADPSFHERGKIDIIFGVGVYRQIIAKGIKKLTNNEFALQKTRLGWIAFGEQSNNSSKIPQPLVISLVSMTEIDANLRRFWELDAQPEERGLTDDFCEKHFKRTVQRQADGRHIVALPFKDENPNLGDSRKAAMA